MIDSFKIKLYIELCLFFFITNIPSSIQNYESFTLKIPLNNSELEPFFIDEIKKDEMCSEWVPSLINPILLINYNSNVSNLQYLYDFQIKSPFLEDEYKSSLYLYSGFNNKYNVLLGKPKHSDTVPKCYFGLSSGLSQYSSFNESQINLNRLKDREEIAKKIFSFSNWTLNNDEINSYLYFGDFHEIFNSSDGIIGTCDAEQNDPFWGCNFTSILFNNNSINLMNEENNYYKIYFSTENHNIIIPKSFLDTFNIFTQEACKEDENDGFLCDFFDEDKQSVELTLGIEDQMNITIEIDRMNRYIFQNETIKPTKTRIIKGNEDYFVFPLIMFKNFYIQFNAEDYKISFYTTDKRILQIKEEKKKKEKGSSNAGTVFLVIFIILLVLALGFGILWLIKKRRSSIQNSINKYNKFEDEENFQDMNEKRVF